MSKTKYMGQRFHLMTVIGASEKSLSTGRKVSCCIVRCDCGTEKEVITNNLVRGKHKSCGCKRLEMMRETSGARGVAAMPVYRVYRQMLDRCYLKTARNYRWYGAKGVRVCDRWRFGEDGKTGFDCFDEDMGPRPEGLTLDRIDPFKNYQPSNCRWATWAQQGKNRRFHHTTGGDPMGNILCLYVPPMGF